MERNSSQFLLHNKPLHTHWLKTIVIYLLVILRQHLSWPQLGQPSSAPCSVSWAHSCICGQPAADGLTHFPDTWLALSQGRGGNWATSLSSPSRLAQAYSRAARGKPQCSCTFEPSAYIMFANVSLAKVSRTVKPRCKEWRNRLNLLMENGVWVQGREGYVAIFAWSCIELGSYRKRGGTFPCLDSGKHQGEAPGRQNTICKALKWALVQKKQSRAVSSQVFF